MKINWKVRLKNPVFWVQLVVAVFAPMLAAAGLSWDQVTSWSALWNVLAGAMGNPAVVAAIIAAAWGILNDPTTAGLSDSERALSYEKPYNGED